MPAALLRPCAAVGCPELVASGRCARHTLESEQRRGTATARGYGVQWRAFCARLYAQLIALDIAPACGARLPGTRETTDSHCTVEGRVNGQRLHVDHIWPLRHDERGQTRVVCDAARVQILCHSCHARKTEREQRLGSGSPRSDRPQPCGS